MELILLCAGRIGLACLCGIVIGFERTTRLKDAGIRTHCIIAIAASLFMIISKYGFSDIYVDGGYLYGIGNVDAARVAAQVVTGIGFLGAGVIFRDGDTLKGLSTAAGVLATAGIGMAIGAGMWEIGLVATAMVVLIQLLFHVFSLGFDAYSDKGVTVEFTEDKEVSKYIESLEKAKSVRVKSISVTKAAGETQCSLHLIYKYKSNIAEIIETLSGFASVHSVSLK